MKAVVLAGGRELGLGPLSRQCPKALLPLANVSLLSHTLGYLSLQGVREVHVCLNEDAASIRRRFPDGRPWGLTLHYVPERIPLGTAGCLRPLQTFLGDAPFILVAGLPFLDFPLMELVATHRKRRAVITAALTDRPSSSGFPEEVVLGEDGLIRQIVVPYGSGDGKPVRTLGVYILDPRVFQFIGRESYLDLKEQLIPRIRQAGLPVVAGQVPGMGVRLDTVADYLRFCHEFLSDGYMGWRAGQPVEQLVRLDENVSVSTSASLHGPILVGNRSVISAEARVEGPTAIETACMIDPGSTVVASVLMEGARVSEGARLERCVVAPSCRVGPGENYTDHLVYRDGDVRWGVSLAASHHMVPTPALRPVESPRRWSRGAAKLILDVCGALLGLTVSAPLLAAAAIAIKLDSSGPVFFRQRRAGRGGREFTVVKLRTMIEGAEQLQAHLADRNEMDGPMFKIGNDPRMTRVGKVLRRTKIDEIPQLINVLWGDMSLVGPRPLAMDEMRCNPAWRDVRLRVKPGATGPWQVESSRKNTFQDWITADITYVERQSLRFDLQILGRTIREVWRSVWSRNG